MQAETGETDLLLPRQNEVNETDFVDQESRLHRSLSARQVQTIALGGAIGTGLFLGTGRSLAAGGPGTMLVCYSATGFIV
jgi:AAT family amino acid transporter